MKSRSMSDSLSEVSLSLFEIWDMVVRLTLFVDFGWG